MSDLVAFLNARLDEDEAAAKAATSGPWQWDRREEYGEWGDRGPKLMSLTATWMSPEGTGPYPVTVVSGYGYDAYGIGVEDADAAHIARHDPARMLREVEAKRKILAEYERTRADRKAHPRDLPLAGALLAVHGVVRALAAVYSDHPEFDDAWNV